MNDSPRRKAVLLVLACAVPLLLVAACISYPQIQYTRAESYLNEFTTQLGLTEQDRLTPPYRYCSGPIIPKCGVNVNYQLTKTFGEFRRDLESLGQASQFYPALGGSTMVININRARIGYLALDGQVISEQTPEEKLPNGGWLEFTDRSGQSFHIERYGTASSSSVFTLNGKKIQGDVITIRLEY